MAIAVTDCAMLLVWTLLGISFGRKVLGFCKFQKVQLFGASLVYVDRVHCWGQGCHGLSRAGVGCTGHCRASQGSESVAHLPSETNGSVKKEAVIRSVDTSASRLIRALNTQGSWCQPLPSGGEDSRGHAV